MPALEDDTYTGPRWRYGLLHRPITAYFIGRDGSGDLPHPILFSHRPSRDPRFPHGEADWPCELPAELAEHHSLVLVSTTVQASHPREGQSPRYLLCFTCKACRPHDDRTCRVCGAVRETYDGLHFECPDYPERVG